MYIGIAIVVVLPPGSEYRICTTVIQAYWLRSNYWRVDNTLLIHFDDELYKFKIAVF